MDWRELAATLKGWKTVDSVASRLHLRRSTAYTYLHRLGKSGFVLQKVKKPRGTMYLIDPRPKPLPYAGMLADTDIVSDTYEFSSREITAGQKIPYLLSEFRKSGNSRYYAEALRLVRGIKSWKALYRHIKAYKVSGLFASLYKEARAKVPKVPRMPLRYRGLLKC